MPTHREDLRATAADPANGGWRVLSYPGNRDEYRRDDYVLTAWFTSAGMLSIARPPELSRFDAGPGTTLRTVRRPGPDNDPQAWALGVLVMLPRPVPAPTDDELAGLLANVAVALTLVNRDTRTTTDPRLREALNEAFAVLITISARQQNVPRDAMFTLVTQTLLQALQTAVDITDLPETEDPR